MPLLFLFLVNCRWTTRKWVAPPLGHPSNPSVPHRLLLTGYGTACSGGRWGYRRRPLVGELRPIPPSRIPRRGQTGWTWRFTEQPTIITRRTTAGEAVEVARRCRCRGMARYHVTSDRLAGVVCLSAVMADLRPNLTMATGYRIAVSIVLLNKEKLTPRPI